MGYDWLVTVVLGLHFGYLAYVVLGGFLAWRWPKAIWPHVVACAWGLLIVAGWVDCPLTWAEDWARRTAGQGPLTEGFIDRYLDNVLYPERYVILLRLAVALLVVASWAGAYLLARRHRVRAARRGRSDRRNHNGHHRPDHPTAAGRPRTGRRSVDTSAKTPEGADRAATV